MEQRSGARKVRAVTESWIDLTSALRYGVYVLKLRGAVVFVGHGRVPLELVAGHRSLDRKITAPWMPFRGIHFDEALLRPSHPDRARAEVAALIAEHDPPGNRLPTPIPLPARTMERRL